MKVYAQAQAHVQAAWEAPVCVNVCACGWCAYVWLVCVVCGVWVWVWVCVGGWGVGGSCECVCACLCVCVCAPLKVTARRPTCVQHYVCAADC